MDAQPISRTLSVDDASDPRLDAYRDLKDVGTRVSGLFIIESELVVRRVVELGHRLHSILLTESRHARLSDVLAENQPDLQVLTAPGAVVNAVVGFPLHRGVVALAERPEPARLCDVLPEGNGVVVVLEDVIDPENIGSVFRHAAGFGADAVVLARHAGDPLFRKSVRSSMGWVLDVPSCRLAPDDCAAETLAAHGCATVALTPDRSAPPLDRVLGDIGVVRPVALLLGAEVAGLRGDTIESAEYQARIPMTGHVDSFNVATTAAIALYELRRTRPLR